MIRTCTQTSSSSTHGRPGFTLIELLVVVTIMLLLFAMTVMAVNFNRDAERVTSAALHVQSFLNGARDRAIHAGEPRGVRFFLDRANYRGVTSMAYIDPAEYWSDGTIQLRRWDANGDGVTDTGPADIDGDASTALESTTDVRVVAGADPGWWELKRRGLLFDGLRIRIPKGTTGTWYSVNTRLIDITAAKTPVQQLILEIPYSDPGDTQVNRAIAYDSSGPVDYELELAPRILPMDPVKFPADTIIDLDASKLPDAWRPIASVGKNSGNHQYSQFMDIVFSPRGNVIGNAASGGVLHFYICDGNDSITLKESFIPTLLNANGNVNKIKFTENGVEFDIGKVITFNNTVRVSPFIPTSEIRSSAATWLVGFPDDTYVPRDRALVTVFTQTGGVATHQVNVSDSDFDGRENEPYYFAETGKGGL